MRWHGRGLFYQNVGHSPGLSNAPRRPEGGEGGGPTAFGQPARNAQATCACALNDDDAQHGGAASGLRSTSSGRPTVRSRPPQLPPHPPAKRAAGLSRGPKQGSVG